MSASTLLNWSRLKVDPLIFTEASAGQMLSTWDSLLAFCEAHVGLRARRTVLAKWRQLETSGSLSGDDQDIESLASMVRSARAAAHNNFEVALNEARAAERAARHHREQLERIAVSMNAFDSMLTMVTAPRTPND